MHPTTVELLEHLDANRAALREALERVPPPLRERRPAADCWSVAEVLEHLSLVEERLAQVVVSQTAAAKAASAPSVEGDGGGWGGRSVVQSLDAAVILDRSRRVAATEASWPRSGADASAAWERLESARRRLREAVIARDGMAPGEFRFQSPALGPLDLNQCIAFVGSHEARHTAQILEIGERLAGSA
ncbi:MAG TPA: DinB family protein [Gemmatimonadaceae bacterium]